jgi:RNA ligase (TIGR02306 family)
MGADFKVAVVQIDTVEKHPNADRLDLVGIKGWNCVTARDLYKPGDLAIYFPIDSVLPASVEANIFGPDSKVKLSKSRVKTIKLRGAISQGLLCSFDTLGMKEMPLGTDLTERLGVIKYEPPTTNRNFGTTNRVGYRVSNPNFHKYTDMSNFKNYPELFLDGEPVYVTEKVHGTSWRAGWLPTSANTLWKKVKKFFGLFPKYEFVYGSRNVQLQDKKYKTGKTGFYESNVYLDVVESLKMREKLLPGEVLYGEVYGDGIQGGYTYGCKPGERKFVAYDVMVDGTWLDAFDFKLFCDSRGIERVPELYYGPYSRQIMANLVDGDSVLAPEQKVREGIVIKPSRETRSMVGRKILKYISDAYLLKDNTDFH